MINKTECFKTYTTDVEYEDGECWDLIGHNNYISFNEIIAKGLNFQKTVIEKDNDYEKDDDWISYIEHTQVIDQDKNKTIMYTRLLTNYYTTDINQFELDCDQYVTIYHNKPLKLIQKDYRNEIQLLTQFQELLESKGYKKQTHSCKNCNYCCDCLNHKINHYKVLTLEKTFNDNQTIGEVKDAFDSDCNFAKEFANQFFNAQTCQSLCFATQGAIGEIEIKQYIK